MQVSGISKIQTIGYAELYKEYVFHVGRFYVINYPSCHDYILLMLIESRPYTYLITTQ